VTQPEPAQLQAQRREQMAEDGWPLILAGRGLIAAAFQGFPQMLPVFEIALPLLLLLQAVDAGVGQVFARLAAGVSKTGSNQFLQTFQTQFRWKSIDAGQRGEPACRLIQSLGSVHTGQFGTNRLGFLRGGQRVFRLV